MVSNISLRSCDDNPICVLLVCRSKVKGLFSVCMCSILFTTPACAQVRGCVKKGWGSPACTQVRAPPVHLGPACHQVRPQVFEVYSFCVFACLFVCLFVSYNVCVCEYVVAFHGCIALLNMLCYICLRFCCYVCCYNCCSGPFTCV